MVIPTSSLLVMFFRSCIVVGISICLRCTCYSQELDWPTLLETYIGLLEENQDYESAIEILISYVTNPINLNKATYDELLLVPGMTPSIAGNLVSYQNKHGALISIYELQLVPGIDLETIHFIKHFVTVRERVTNDPLLKRILEPAERKWIVRLISPVERANGYRSESYSGNPRSTYHRLIWRRTGDYSIGWIGEKDAGERFEFNRQQQGFDFQTAHVMFNQIGPFKSVVVGDYNWNFGQGLVFGNGFNLGKGSDPIVSTVRSNTGIRPYSSAIEHGFFRGASTTIQSKKLTISTGVSRLKIDGRISTEDNSDKIITSLPTSGYHRTDSEIETRKKATQYDVALNISRAHRRNLLTGINFLYTSFNHPISRRVEPYNIHEFNGSTNLVISGYYRFLIENITISGESAISGNGSPAHVVSWISPITHNLDVSLLFRNYDMGFHSFQASGFGESSRTINERGFYWGLKWKPSKKHEIAAYYDIFAFPWLRFSVHQPSEGDEYMARYKYSINRHTSILLQFRNEKKERSYSFDSLKTDYLVEGKKRAFMIQALYKVNESLTMKTRLQSSQYQILSERTRGLSMSQDINLSFRKAKIHSRFAIFGTDNFENRQYQYENNLLYSFSIPAYSGEGIRVYVMTKLPVDRKIDCWIRYGLFQYFNQESIGSGNDEIPGNRRSDLRFQIIWEL